VIIAGMGTVSQYDCPLDQLFGILFHLIFNECSGDRESLCKDGVGMGTILWVWG